MGRKTGSSRVLIHARLAKAIILQIQRYHWRQGCRAKKTMILQITTIVWTAAHRVREIRDKKRAQITPSTWKRVRFCQDINRASKLRQKKWLTKNNYKATFMRYIYSRLHFFCAFPYSII